MKTTDEIHDLIQNCPVEPTETAINKLLVICDHLNQRLASVSQPAVSREQIFRTMREMLLEAPLDKEITDKLSQEGRQALQRSRAHLPSLSAFKKAISESEL